MRALDRSENAGHPDDAVQRTAAEDRNRMVGRYDSRLTAPFDPEQVKMYDPTRDPEPRDIIDDVAVVRYLRSELKFESDLPLPGTIRRRLSAADTFRGDWMSVRGTDRRRPAAGTAADCRDQPLRRAMTRNPALRVLYVVRLLRPGVQLLRQRDRGVELDPALRRARRGAAITAAATRFTPTTRCGWS